MPSGKKRVDEQPDPSAPRPPAKRHRSGQSEASRRPVFSEKVCLEWFREYTTVDEPDLLGPEGMERFCRDVDVAPENVVMLILAWLMEAQNMGYFTSQEWLRGLSHLEADSADVLRLRIPYMMSLLDQPDSFKAIYRFAFDFTREKAQRSVDLETGLGMLKLLLDGRWPLCGDLIRFLTQQSRYRVINKDQWNSVLEFSRCINLDLSNYDENGAWPVMLDDFVAWYRLLGRQHSACGPSPH